MSDTQIYLGNVKSDLFWRPDNFDFDKEIWNRYNRLALQLLIDAVNESIQFYRIWKEFTWVWTLQHQYEKDCDFGRHADPYTLYRDTGRKIDLTTLEVRTIHNRFRKDILNQSYLRIMYGHLDWLLESLGYDREDLLDEIHKLADGERLLGVTEPDIRVLDLPIMEGIRPTVSVMNSRRPLPLQFL
jgi:hypothetical protein